jgi:nucleoside-diphosphate-sugar epimerase
LHNFSSKPVILLVQFTYMKYFVTGATGFIGGRVVQQLVNAGHEVIAVVRDPSKAGSLKHPLITVFRGDILDKKSMYGAMSRVDGVFHLAAWYKLGARNDEVAPEINIGGTQNVLELMRDLKIARGVYTSTLAVYSDTHGKVVDESYYHAGPWLSEYDRTKWEAHYKVAKPMMEAGLPLVIVQPGLTYGPGDTSNVQQTFEQYLNKKLSMLPEQAAYCWGHVDDIARGHIQAMEQGKTGESYNLAGPAYTLIDAFAIAEKITGVPAPRRHIKPGQMQQLSKLMGIAGKVVALPSSYMPETLRVLAGATYLGSSAKAERELGFTTRPLEDGLRETLAYEINRLGLG